MLNFIRKILSAPTFPEDEEKNRLSSVFNIILLFDLGYTGLMVIFDYLGGGNGFISALAIFLASIPAFVLFRLRLVDAAAKYWLGAAWIVVTGITIMQGGITSPIHYLLAVVLLVAGLLYGPRGGVTLTALSLISLVIIYLTQGKISPELLRDQPTDLRRAEIAAAVFINAFLLTTWTMNTLTKALDQARGNAVQLTLSNRELTRARERLEEKVNERTAEFERRANQLQISAEVGRAASSMHDLTHLLPQVVSMVAERFDFYHVAIFLVDESEEFAVMKAASSAGGRRMLNAQHRISLKVGEKELPEPVQACILQRKPATAVDAGQAFGMHYNVRLIPNPDLVNTRSEIALPLVVGEITLGALDIHSDKPGAFSEDDTTLQVLADQIAISIENARLFSQNQEALEAARRAYGEISREVWLERLQARSLAVKRDARGVISQEGPEMPTLPVSGRDETGALIPAETGALAIPIKVRGFPIGIIKAKKPAENGTWTSTEQNVLQSLVDQLGLALDGARLYEETQERAERERLVAEVTSSIRQTLDLDSVVQTATQEIFEALHLHDVTIRVGSTIAANLSEEK